MTLRYLAYGLLSALLCSLGCEGAPSSSNGSVGFEEGVLARVNGQAIRKEELAQRASRAAGHSAMGGAESERAVLDGLIRQELMAQAAEKQQLDRDPEYQQKRRKLEAELNELRREQLAALLEREWLKGKTQPSEAEARAYFDANQERIRTELHVQQILKKGAGSMDAIQQALAAGTSFDDVLKREFPALPEGVAPPWDMGYLKWSQIPDVWRPVTDAMKPGEVSPIIAGPKERFWIIRLVDRRSSSTSFEDEKARIIELLAAEKRETARQAVEAELQKGAVIEYAPGH